MSGITYIKDSKKPYPAWIPFHKVFSNLTKIEKVWPTLGLANFSEEIEICNNTEATKDATNLIAAIHSEFVYQLSNVKSKYSSCIIMAPSKERNELCNKVQYFLNLTRAVSENTAGKIIPVLADKKVSISNPVDIFDGRTASPIFKKGESYLKVISSLNQMAKESGTNFNLNYETYDSFKTFSRSNLAGKKYKMHFLSTGEDGAWDIATASMRGIQSCQAWHQSQAKGLIGSIVSKYVAVCYIEGQQDFPPYGKQMLFRGFVRLIINKANGKPALYMDHMYPHFSVETFNSIKQILERKSGIPVMAAQESSGSKDKAIREYFILDETVRAQLGPGEVPYMDTAFSVIKRPFPLIVNPQKTTNAIASAALKSDWQSRVSNSILTYKIKYLDKDTPSPKKNDEQNKEVKVLTEGMLEAKPPLHHMSNFFKHFTRKDATTADPTKHFSEEVFKVIGLPDENEALPKKSIASWYLKRIVSLNKDKGLRDKVIENNINGSWNKAFPKSSKKFVDLAIAEIKKEVIASYKNA